MIEIKTLTDKCADDCAGFDPTHGPDGWRCSKLWLCQYGAKALYDSVLEKYEEEQHKALNKTAGLKEHAVWHKAIMIIEGLMR